MSLSERDRHHLYETARRAFDGRAADTLMSLLPPVGWADVATKADLGAVDSRLTARIDALERTMRADLRAEIHMVRAEMHSLFRAQTWRFSGAILAGMGLAAAIARLG